MTGSEEVRAVLDGAGDAAGGDAAAVAGDDVDLRAIELDEVAAEDEALLLGAGGEGGLRQQGAEDGVIQRQLGDGLAFGGFDAREGREVRRVNGGEIVLGLAAFHGEVVALEFEAHVRGVGHANDVEQQAGAHGGLAFLADGGFDLDAQMHVQVGGGEVEVVAFAHQQEVGEDRQCPAPGDRLDGGEGGE